MDTVGALCIIKWKDADVLKRVPSVVNSLRKFCCELLEKEPDLMYCFISIFPDEVLFKNSTSGNTSKVLQTANLF